jgi:uncharacterized repeat protein (TIGR03803 family)
MNLTANCLNGLSFVNSASRRISTSKYDGWKHAVALFLLCVATAIASPATTFTSRANFDASTGASPYFMSLVQGTDGNYYGTTRVGGSEPDAGGTIFKITPGGTLTALYSFSGPDGMNPYVGLVQASDGNLYGTTLEGGANGYGTVFRITLGGTLTTLHSFDFTDGASPVGLVQASNGDLYGTTSNGGSSCNCGTVFKITTGGSLTTLHIFMGFPDDGAYPWGTLIQASNGDLYGTSFAGGGGNVGTIYKINLQGKITTLFAFSSSSTSDSGINPYAGLVQDPNGDFYGTTSTYGEGGAASDGTVFKMTPDGAFTTLHSFEGKDGANPDAGLVLGTDGNFYGTTNAGGADNVGTIFKITPGGKLTPLLHSFARTDGANPSGGLMQATNGTFYGTTEAGGADGDGTVFSLSTGLGPFVKTVPSAADVGAAVRVLGTKLNGATSVTFNGVSATFTVRSNSEIKTTVPAGATTGTVKVVTPSRVLESNVAFQVTP